MFSTLARLIDGTPSAKLFIFTDSKFIPLNLASFLMCQTISNRHHKLMTQYTLAHLFLDISLPQMASFRCKFLYSLFCVWFLVYLVQLKSGCHIPKFFFIFCNENPSEIIKDAFYFILKALFILKIFKFLSWHFGHVEKTAWLEE